MKIFESIATSEGLQPFILAKLSIALSLNSNDLTPPNFRTDTDGLELNRQTILGEYESLFKSLVILKEQTPLSEDEFFPKFVKAHLDRGATLLSNEVRYGMNFYSNLVHLDKNI